MNRPFSSASPWNTQVGSGAIFQSQTGTETAAIEHQAGTVTWILDNSISIYQASSFDPLATWSYDSHEPNATWQYGGAASGSFQTQTPSNLQFQTGDGWAVLKLVDGQNFIETWLGLRNSDGSYHASYIVENNLNGTGISSPGHHDGVRAGGTSLLGGLVTKQDLDTLNVDHAIALGLPTSMLKASSDPTKQYVWPAASADSGGSSVYTGTIPMGALFAIPKTVDLSKAGITTPEGMALAKAYQTYGGYVSDTTDSRSVNLAFLETGASQHQVDNLRTDMTAIRNLLQLVTNNSVTSVGGGNAASATGASAKPVSGGNAASPVPCFVTDTVILTDRGEVAVQDLKVSDKVVNASGQHRRICWIGSRFYPELTAPKSERPVRIRAGAFEDGVPARDLLVSPDHAVMVDGLFVAAGHLVNGTSISRGEAVADLTYWHVELDSHDLLLAENTPAESFLAASGVRAGFDGVQALDAGAAPVPYALRVELGPELAAVRGRLARRGICSDKAADLGPVRAWLDRCVVGADGLLHVGGWAQDTAWLDTPVCLDIVVDGLVVAFTVASEPRADLAAIGMGDGRHGFDLGLDVRLTPQVPHVVEVRRSADNAMICAMAADVAGRWTPLLAA